MSRENEHRERWLHNRKFVGTIDDAYCDWILTAAFYAAVHAVETLVAHDGLPNHTSHDSRSTTLQKTNKYKQIWKHYHTLYNASLTTRYHCSPSLWVPVKEIKDKLIPTYLYPIEKSVQKLLGDATDLGIIKWADPKK
jgi:hypothetical protein